MKYPITSILVLLAISIISAQSYEVGHTYYSENQFAEYRAGDLPLIIVAPHGGLIAPDSIPDRNCSGCVYLNDAYTQNLARQLDSAIIALTGHYPHLIINHLHRKKLDANREIVEAANGNPYMENAWNQFHTFITAASDTIEQNCGRGLYLDIHGHAHTLQRIELGYLLSVSELQLSDSILNVNYTDDCSIQHKVITNPSNWHLSDYLHGNPALGTLFVNAGYLAVPSDSIPYPLSGEPYFNGGYNTSRYGSYPTGVIDAVQIECPTSIRNTWPARHNFAIATANIINEYLPWINPVIEGETNICNNQIYNYSVISKPGAMYNWTINGGQIISGQGTNVIAVQWNNNNIGNVSVEISF